MIKPSKKVAAVAAGGVLAVATAGGAYAFWTTTGGGNGSASTGTNTAVTVTQTSTVGDLVPGGAAKALDFKINNPISTPQYVTSVLISVKNADGSAWSAQADATKAACTAADFSITQPSAIRSDLGAGDTQFNSAGTTGTGATIALVNGSANQDNCKNVTAPLAYVAS